jgi:hypothetical protein
VSLPGLWVGLDERTPVGSPARARMGRAGPEGGLPVIPSPRGGGMEGADAPMDVKLLTARLRVGP